MFNPQTFWQGRPANITPLDWLTHPANEQALPFWVQELVRLIKDLGKPETFFKQKWLIGKVNRSIRQIKEMISRLKQIGLISIRRVFRTNRMRLVALEPAPKAAPQTAPVHEKKKKEEQELTKADPFIQDAYYRYTRREKYPLPFHKWIRTKHGLFVGL